MWRSALTSLFVLAACRSTGTGDASPPLPTATDAGATKLVVAADAAPAVPSNGCVGHRVTWTRAGGLRARHATSKLSGCRTYGHDFVPERPDAEPRKPCTTELPLAASPTTSQTLAEDVARAISDPEVQAAFARGGSVGRLQSPHDGVDVAITLDDVQLMIGKGPPPAISRLVQLLEGLDQQAVATGACAK